MRQKRDNGAYLKHIRDAMKKIATYTSGHTLTDFSREEWDQDAVVRNLEIIGEAARNLDVEFRNRYAEIPWRAIIDFRNVAVHDCADIDVEIIWQIITDDLVELQQRIEKILTDKKLS